MSTPDGDAVNTNTITLIKSCEGCYLHSYRDPVGVWTIGYGHTGSDVHPSQTISQQKADQLLYNDLAKFEDGVDDLLDENTNTTDNQFGAMVSLAYNVGLGNFEKSSVLRYHNEGKNWLAAEAFLLFNKAGGRILPGLVRRRELERRLYLTP